MKPSPDNVPEIVGRYFELDAQRDVDLIVALFSDDATVIDEGKPGTMRSAAGGPVPPPSTSTRR
jgi:hypothetical protein